MCPPFFSGSARSRQAATRALGVFRHSSPSRTDAPLDRGNENREIERFLDEAIDMRVDQQLSETEARAHDDDRRRAAFSPAFQKLEAIHDGHHQVEEDHVGRRSVTTVECLLAVRHGGYPVTLIAESSGNHIANRGVVFSDQHVSQPV